MSPRLFAALVAVLAAFGAAGMLAAQRDVPPPVRQTTAQAIAVARGVPAIPALTPGGGPPALAQRARRPKKRHAPPARPRPAADRSAPAPATPLTAAAPRSPTAPREPAPRQAPPPRAPAPEPPTAAPVAPAPVPDVGEEAEEGTGEEVAPE